MNLQRQPVLFHSPFPVLSHLVQAKPVPFRQPACMRMLHVCLPLRLTLRSLLIIITLI
ncbi:hypothetical protein IMSAGC022_00762 [Alistipes sp.]|nr:hypothetical protein IMSAGC022_00762 [Alistipes sp.]